MRPRSMIACGMLLMTPTAIAQTVLELDPTTDQWTVQSAPEPGTP